MNNEDQSNGAPWFEALCFACATLVTLILGLALWDLLR
jgi:hypothetical protein